MVLQKCDGQSPGAHATPTAFISWDPDGLGFLNLSLFLWEMGLRPALIQRGSVYPGSVTIIGKKIKT